MTPISSYVESLLNKEDAISKLITLLDNEKYKNEVVVVLGRLRDRAAIIPMLNHAKIDIENGKDNSIYFYALTQFNCEEYLQDILRIGINSKQQARFHILEILATTQGISLKNKQILTTSLNLKKELLTHEKNPEKGILNFIIECQKLMDAIPVNGPANVINMSKNRI